MTSAQAVGHSTRMRASTFLSCCLVILAGACRSEGLSIPVDGVASKSPDGAAAVDLAPTSCASAEGVCASKNAQPCLRTHVGDPSLYPCGDATLECCLPGLAGGACDLPDNQQACRTVSDCDRFTAICADAEAGGPCVCAPQNCDPDVPSSCNDVPSLSSLRGRCNVAGACDCFPGSVKSRTTGKCR